MPQDRDSNRHASLDDQKERAAGRMDEAKRPFQRHTDEYAKHDPHSAGGAFGQTEGLTLGKGDDRGSNLSEGGGGGGGGGPTTAKDEQSAKTPD